MIPNRLKKDDYRFCLVKAKDKDAFEEGWNDKGYKHDDPRLQAHLRSGGNYGVICGPGQLIIIDFDNMDAYTKVKDQMPITFTVKSGSGKFHYYYQIADAKNIIIRDKETGRTKIEIRAKRLQCVGPGSTHPSGGKYEVHADLPITKIHFEQLLEIFAPWLPEAIKPKKNKHDYGEDSLRDIIKQKWRVSDQLAKMGIDAGHNPTKCPFHESERGKCLHFDDEKGVWYCFHCEEGGDVFSLVMMEKNLRFPDAKIHFAKELKLSQVEAFKKGREKFELDYLEAAKDFLNTQPLWYDESGNWWVWDHKGTCWRHTDDVDVMNLIDCGDNDYEDTVRGEVQAMILRSLQRQSRLRKPKDMPVTWVQFQDTIIDFKDNSIRDATPDYFCTNPLPHQLGKTGDTPAFDRLFADWVGVENAPLLYEILAFCCAGDYFIQRVLAFVGSGSNGKSTYLKILRNFIGDTNCCELDLDAIHTNKFETSKLYRKLVAYVNETNFDKMGKTSRLKSLSSGMDVVSAEFKGKDSFSFVNHAKIIIATNTLPDSNDSTDGFYRRWLIVDFPNKFPDEKDVLCGVTREEYMNLSRKVTSILHDLYERHAFTNEGSIEVRKQRFEDRANPIKRFIKEYCVESVSDFVFSWEFNQVFRGFCERNGIRVRNDAEVGRWMLENGYEKFRPGTEERRYAYRGLRWVKHVTSITTTTSAPSISEILRKESDVKMVDATDVVDVELFALMKIIAKTSKNGIPGAQFIEICNKFMVPNPEGLLEKWKTDGKIMTIGPDRYMMV